MVRAEPSQRRIWASGRLLAVLIGVRIAMLIVAIVSDPAAGPTTDAARFEQIATSPGRPWRDISVEYPPGELILIEVIAGDGPDAVRDHLALLSFAGDIGTAGAIAWGWGRRSTVAYLAISSPLLTFLYWRLDPAFVAVAVVGIVIARRRSAAALAGFVLAVASLGRLWPVVVVPAVGRRALVRTAVAFAVAVTVGVGAWLAYGGWSAPGQVAGSRGATGWSADGLVGSVLWLFGHPARTEVGSLRVGSVDARVMVILGIALVIALGWIWWRGVWTPEPAGLAAATAVATLLVLSPLFSVQYVAWLIPWVAVATLDDRRLVVLASAASVAAGAFPITLDIAASGPLLPLQLAFVVKNVAVVGIALVGIRALASDGNGDASARIRAR